MRGTIVVVCVIALAGCEQCNKFNGDDTAQPDAMGLCTTNAECGPDTVCSGGACILPGTTGPGGMCFATRDCMMGLNCTELGVCAPAGTGAAGASCETAADCTAGLACIHDGFGGTCTMAGTTDLGGACTTSANCIAGLACGTSNTCGPFATAYPPFAGVQCEADKTTFGVYFEVPRTGQPLADFFRLPFPNDIRVKANGQLDLSDFPRPGKSALGVDVVDLYADALETDFEGFSAVAPVTFRFTRELDFDTLGPNGLNIRIADITEGTPQFGQELVRAYSYGTGAGKFACQHQLNVGNDRNNPLIPGHTYAAYMLTAIRGKNGEVPVVPPDLTAVLGASMPSDPDLAAAWTKYAKFRAYLAAEPIATGNIAGAAVFTVGDHSARARQIAAHLEATAIPTLTDLTLCDGVNVSPCAGEDGRACGSSSGSFWEIHGKYSEPNYQDGTLPYATDGGAITYAGTTPNTHGTTEVCFALTIPKSTMPGTGWPLVVHGHGTGGSFKSAVDGGIAETLASASSPLATLTFDGVVHGARRNGSPRSVDSLVFNVINPRAARDNHLQGAVDVIQALRIAQVPQFTVATQTIAFDATRTYYFGHSQGSNVGIPALGVTDVASAAVLSGAGTDLTIGILTKTSPVNAKAGLQYLLGEPIGGGHPVMVLWQTFFERIDPISFTQLLVVNPPAGVASKHILQTWSATDTYSAKESLTATAKSARLFQAEPVIEAIGTADARPITTNRTAGDGPIRFATVFQYASDGTYDGHFVAQRNAQAIADWTAFFTSLVSTGTPTVP